MRKGGSLTLRKMLSTTLATAMMLMPAVDAMGQVVPPPDLNPLNQTAVPEPPQINLYIKNMAVARQLGKAFFWDMQAGSDGIVACATCHHSAGVDKRLKNTLNPGTAGGDTIFGNSSVAGVPGFPQFGANYTLDPVNDFPTHRRAGEGHLQTDAIIQDTNDVVGSQGVVLSDFTGVVPGSAVDSVPAAEADPIFRDPVYGNVRRVTGRNTPTVINAVFNFSNFWDGRANMRFNGENPFGPADPNAGVWYDDPAQPVLAKRPVVIEFASLASQATGPPMDSTEMSGRGRTFPMLGRKMLGLTPLGKQLVSHDDSVLGGLAASAANPGAKGLHTGYADLIQAAFMNNLWSSAKLTPDGFTQMEANFALFWGLSIQLYEATLVSGDSPFDRWLAGDTTAMTDHQQNGFAVFMGVGNCAVCHIGTEFTDHSVAIIGFQNNTINNIMELMFTSDGTQTIYDEGFINNSVRPTAEDIGRGGTAPFTNPRTGQPYPLSLSALAELQAQGLLPFESPILPPFIPVNFPITRNGAFKVPGLRNVELTGPYFHNGSEPTLDQVVNFYSRGGNFPLLNLHDLDPVIGAGLMLLSNNQTLHEQVTDFLTTLTDPRVRDESAPFDHPELFVPEGAPERFIHIVARSSDGSPFGASLSINPVVTPTRESSQTISGTVEAGLTPTVTVDTAAVVGPVTVVGADWSVQITGLIAGSNVITAKVVDAASVETTATASITFIPNTAPVATNDGAAITINTARIINVLANDTDTDGNIVPSTVAVGTAPAHGTTAVNPATGAVTYTPALNYIGADSFTYTVADAGGLTSNAATVNLTVNGAIDTITVTRALYMRRAGQWMIQGATSAPGSSLTFYTGPNATGSVIGSAVARTRGRTIFRFIYRNRNGVVPDASNTISVRSSPNGTVISNIPVTVR